MSTAAEILEKKQKLGIDSVMLAKLSDPAFANGKDRHFGIERKKVIALKLMLFSFNTTDNRPSAEERQIVHDFLATIRGDMVLNKEFKQIAFLGLAGTGRGGALIAKLISYIYKTRHHATFATAFKKLSMANIDTPTNIASMPGEKVSLREYSNIYDIAHIAPLLDELAKKGFFETNPELSELSEFTEFFWQAKSSAKIIMQIESKYRAPYLQDANADVTTTRQAGN